MPYGLRVTTASTIEPVTVKEARKHCELTDGTHDVSLAAYISAARELVESETGRTFISRTYELTLDEFPSGAIYLPAGPVSGTPTVTYTDASGNTGQSFTDFDVSLYRKLARLQTYFGEVLLATRAEEEALKVSYVYGEGSTPSDVPDAARHAILLLVGHWFEHREAVTVGQVAREVPFSAQCLIDSLNQGSEYHGVTG